MSIASLMEKEVEISALRAELATLKTERDALREALENILAVVEDAEPNPIARLDVKSIARAALKGGA